MKKALRNFLSILCLIACCPCCFPCYYCAFRNRKRRRRDNEATELELWRGPKSPQDVHPLPTRRRRLSIPSRADGLHVRANDPILVADQMVAGQEQCLLFARLPLELRQHIWKEVVGGFDVYLGIINEKLQHCKLFGTSEDQEVNVLLQSEYKLLPILLTCRRVYAMKSFAPQILCANTTITATPRPYHFYTVPTDSGQATSMSFHP
jgi:hypothetical protein